MYNIDHYSRFRQYFSGVILATNKYGFRLEPVSWNEMRCPKTGVQEPRKTAKVLPQYIESNKE